MKVDVDDYTALNERDRAAVDRWMQDTGYDRLLPVEVEVVGGEIIMRHGRTADGRNCEVHGDTVYFFETKIEAMPPFPIAAWHP